MRIVAPIQFYLFCSRGRKKKEKIMRRKFIKQVGLGALGALLLPKIVFSNDKIIKGMRKKPMLAYPVSAKLIDYSKPTFIQPKLETAVKETW